MHHATLQHALAAMHAGRLDEAATLLTDPKVRPHRKAQDALSQVCEQLVQRGQQHFDARRWDQAHQDAQRVLAIEPGHPDAAALLGQVARHATDARHQVTRAADALAYARRLADLGHSSRARAVVPALDETAGQRLAEQLDIRKLERQSLIERGEAALARTDYAEAASAVERLAAFPPSTAVETLKQALNTEATRAAEGLLRNGELQAATVLLSRTQASNQLTQACHELCVAAEYLARGDASASLPRLQRVASQLPKADWLSQVIKDARSLRDTQEALATGPLGPLADMGTSRDPSPSRAPTRAVGWSPRSPIPSPHLPVAQTALSHTPLILHQDDQPLAILWGAPHLALAEPGDGDHDALPLLASASGLKLTLRRDEDGHLVRAPSALTVNRKPTTEALLVHDDRCGLGPRLRLRYLRANAASQTAVLDLTAGRFVTPNLRRVVLLAGELLVGPHRGCHLRNPKLENALTFRPAGDGLDVEGVSLTAGGGGQHVHGHAWSVTHLDARSA